ncbi:MAG: hypothetical protein JWO97_1394 [Acidobacteria bacterium]|nr:hypothetical protein [Acidobacteriota bacterium]
MQKLAFALVVAMLLAVPMSAQLVAPRGATPELLIPAAGAVQGVNGTFFRSDITLINYRTTNQLVRLRWLPENTPGSDVAPVDVTIGASSGIVSEDFVTTILGRSGLGAILVTAINSDGSVDENGRLFATARIWTPQAGTTNGTTSQTFPTLSTADIPQTDRLAIIGQRRDDRYRLNVGIVNLGTARAQTFIVTVSAGSAQTAETVVVPPSSIRQIALPGAATSTLQITVQNVTAGTQLPFVAYGSSVDNVTGDGWSSLGFTP